MKTKTIADDLSYVHKQVSDIRDSCWYTVAAPNPNVRVAFEVYNHVSTSVVARNSTMNAKRNIEDFCREYIDNLCKTKRTIFGVTFG